MYRDDSFRRELTENCYRDLIASGRYSYLQFMREFDEGLEAAGVKPGISEELARRVTDWLHESERSLLIKKIEVQGRGYQELVNRDVALQVQYMEQQKAYMNQQSDMHKLAEAHQALQVQYMEQQKWLQQLLDQKAEAQGQEVAYRDSRRIVLPRQGNFHGIGVYMGRWIHSARVSIANWCRLSKVFFANALRPYPFVYKVVRSIWRGFRKSEGE